ncbi:hypothetical protein EYF80_033311 [Liparis tanakae]|uniref:Uncharacterized protein n=1 Tax=Liparis tanakae TaxID=230148 RepID=A0A4Z2GT01_9TELE|nr:hypothetical protein EYF80_033311 [Liparis tanakae]
MEEKRIMHERRGRGKSRIGADGADYYGEEGAGGGTQGLERKDNNISPRAHAAGDFPREEGGGGGGGEEEEEEEGICSRLKTYPSLPPFPGFTPSHDVQLDATSQGLEIDVKKHVEPD